MSRKKYETYGLSKIHVDQFRALHDLDLELGQRVTVIAGQNGTGKSTILGMLGQPFGLSDCKTIFGKSFRTKFTDVFKMSPEFDIPGEHQYELFFRDESISEKQGIPVRSYKRPSTDKSHIRFVTGATRARGEGNIDYPVIYLGLKRTYPLGEIANPKAEASNLSSEEKKLFNGWYSDVVTVVNNESIEPIRLSNGNQKNSLLINTKNYDYLANSAGEDNLGQILGAFLSFKRLKKEMGDNYKGGLFLIDELDATLFPSSQKVLFNLIFDQSIELRVQVIFTTHSLTLIEHASFMQEKYNDDIKILYLRKRESGIQLNIDPGIDLIKSDLLLEPIRPIEGLRVDIWCEDSEARWFLTKLLPYRLKKKCKLFNADLSCGELDNLAIRTEKIDSLKCSLFIVDGDDQKKNSSTIIRNCNRRFVLPGGEMSPEQSIYDLLLSLSDEDPFWSESLYASKQTFIKGFNEGLKDWKRETNGKTLRKYYKLWFKKEKASGRWGRNGDLVYKKWKNRYSDEINSFCQNLENRVDGILQRMEHERKES